MISTIAELKKRLEQALSNAFGAEYAAVDPILEPASNPKFGDYQANVAMSLAKPLGQAPRAIAEKIVQHLDVTDLCEPPTVAGPGFINLRLKTDYLETQLSIMLADTRLGVARVGKPQRVIVDFSSPNIAKEMHVGHLRSTIIGDAIAHVLEFQGHDVLRLNHVGDWGTQFGMLITYLREAAPEALITADAIDLGDLVAFYKKAKQRFDEDETFRDTARQEVVRLQSGAEDTLKAWKLLCDQSRREFQIIYDLLDVTVTKRGESFYNSLLPDVAVDLEKLGLLVTDQGAKCVFLEGFSNKEGEPMPLIVQKSDGGYNYATTDLAAIRYRVQQDQAERILYLTDIGQSNHFAQVFQVARRAEWLPNTVKVEHVPFGLVLGDDGKKLKTRSGETVRLRELLDEAVNRARTDLETRIQAEDRQETEDFIAHVSQVVGIGAVKYADLSQNRTGNYIFSFDKMLALNGNTAPYMLYAYVRIQGITRKGQIDFENLFLQQEQLPLFLGRFQPVALWLDRWRTRCVNETTKILNSLPKNSWAFSVASFWMNSIQNLLPSQKVQSTQVSIQLHDETEFALAKHLLQLDEIIAQVGHELFPNRLCQYLFELSQKFNQFYDRCPVLQAEEPLRTSRLALCNLTANTLKLGLSLLGISVLERM